MKAHASKQLHPMTAAAQISVVKALMIFLGAVFVAEQFWGSSLRALFALTPQRVIDHFCIWQLVSYLFLHGDVLHLLLIAAGLYFCGRELEQRWGRLVFFKYFLLCGISAGVCAVLLSPASQAGTIGSSGALLGVFLGYVLYFPGQTIFRSFKFEISMKVVLALYGALVVYVSLPYTGRGIASLAPLGSLAAGFLYLNYYSFKYLTGRQLREYRAQQARKRYQVIDGGKMRNKGRRAQVENGQV